MSKRKLADYVRGQSVDLNGLDHRTARQRAQIEHRVDGGKKELQRALKLASQFERQKHSRRKKTATAKNDTKTLERLEKEYAVLKALPLPRVATTHLYKSLLKVKAIAASPALPPTISDPPKLANDPATLNVTARLYKANQVQAVVKEVVDQVLAIVQSGGAKQRKTEKSGEGRAKDGTKAKSQHHSGDSEDDGSEWSGEGSDEEAEGDGGSDVGSDEFAGFDDRIAGSSDEGSDGEEEDQHCGQRRYSPTKDLSLSPEPSEEESDEEPGKARVVKPAKPNKSTFLPSLTMGGYWSGSDSEPEDLDVAPPRKNRRGQRARQAIWEKKFGASAKHIQKKQADERKKGWDPKRGAQPDGEGRHGKGFKRGNNRKTGSSSASAANSVAVNPRRPSKKDDAGPLHPSWEAAKRAKEQKQTAAFQGKKIVFD